MDQQGKAPKILILAAGAKGAIGSTLATAVATLKTNPDKITNSLTTQKPSLLPFMGGEIEMAGWDRAAGELTDHIIRHKVLPDHLWRDHSIALNHMGMKQSPDRDLSLADQVEQLTGDIRDFQKAHGDALPVLVNLLPSAMIHDLSGATSLKDLYADQGPAVSPDLAYVLAAVTAGIPVVNFTPNAVEIPVVVDLALANNVPLSGRDGKTGQTFFKMVIASALKARHLYVNGWYSLNILGNADGQNLMNPENAAGKLMNKTDLLDEILGYSVGEPYGVSSHKVHIDYYPPRGDAKEAWDVVDMEGLFGMPMSLRLNLQGRDSILAAPMVLDLCRWMTALQQAGRKGLVPELAFYFKKSVGVHHLFTYEAQIAALAQLEKTLCRAEGKIL